MSNFESNMDSCHEFFFDMILPSLNGKEEQLCDIESPEDHVCPHYVAFVSLARVLVQKGWTPEELVADVQSHANDQKES